MAEAVPATGVTWKKDPSQWPIYKITPFQAQRTICTTVLVTGYPALHISGAQDNRGLGKQGWVRGSHLAIMTVGSDYSIQAKPSIRHGQLSKDSGAGALAAGNPNETGKMAPTPVYAWLSDFERDRDHDIMEESRATPSYGGILSLLWARDEIED